MELFPPSFKINRKIREGLYGHNNFCLWFTGYSGSGKSTLANYLERRLFFKHKRHTYILDGDNLRSGLCKDLGFSKKDRKENVRRVAETARILIDSGCTVLSCFISPYREDRKIARDIIGKEDFVEIHVNCSLEECERRDVKGLYKRARAGKIKNFTGISDVYENPTNPDIRIDTENQDLNSCLVKIEDYLSDTILYKV